MGRSCRMRGEPNENGTSGWAAVPADSVRSNGTLPSVRDPQALKHLAASYPLAMAPDLLLFGHPEEHDYSDPALTNPVRDHWRQIRASRDPEPRPWAVPDDPTYQQHYHVSHDAEGRLHSLDDQPALYIYETHSDFLSAYYMSHGEHARAGDLPHEVAMYPERNQLSWLRWHVPTRPGGAPTDIYHNGPSGQALAWGSGRFDGPIAVDRYAMGWGLSLGPLPEPAQPPVTVLFAIAYASAQHLADSDARLLVHHLEALDPSPTERQVLVRTLLRWQPGLSEDMRSWLPSLI